jgi:hypothetical protein
MVRDDNAGTSRHPEHRPKRRFVLLRRDGERRGKCNTTLSHRFLTLMTSSFSSRLATKNGIRHIIDARD